MARQRKGLRAVLREITHGAERSPLFWWMVENHDHLSSAAVGRRIRWEALCARVRALGLTDATGKPASPATARQTWLRARRAVAKAGARMAAEPPPRPGAKYPSRISQDWRPTEAVPFPPVRPPWPAPAAATTPAPAPGGGDGETRTRGQIEIDKAMAALRAEDRRRFGP